MPTRTRATRPAAARRTRAPLPRVAFHPATAARWSDVAALFGERGACAGCWCMFWRLPRARFTAGKGEGNRRAFKALIESNAKPGVIAYTGREPVGWCAVAPRADYLSLANSRVLKPVDEKPVWSISCLFVRRDFRKRGLSSRLIDAAAKLAAKRGARIVEGYPVEASAQTADAFVWTGLASSFTKAGFREVARRSPTRPIMRRAVRAGR